MKKVRISITAIILLVTIFNLVPVTYGGLFNSTTKIVSNNVKENNYNDAPMEPTIDVDEDSNTMIDEPEVINEVNETPELETISTSDSNKKVFLTFDDGPTGLTPKVLDILRDNDINATFFTIGKLIEQYPEVVLRTYGEGNMVLPHSYTHDFAMYSTFETFYGDFYMAEEAYRKVLGFDSPPYFRFPGGSSNHSSFKYGGKQFMPLLTKDVKEKGYYYIDWNVSAGDTTPDYKDTEKMLDNVLKDTKNKDFAVILFHDLEKNTKMLEILPVVIGTLKEQGYTFRTFRDITEDEIDKMVELKLANKTINR